MRGLVFRLLVAGGMLVSVVAHAATEVTVDWSSGEVRVHKDDPVELQPAQPLPDTTCKENKKRLRAIIERQQAIIMRQQQKLQEQRAIMRRQDDVIRGLDALRRRGR